MSNLTIGELLAIEESVSQVPKKDKERIQLGKKRHAAWKAHCKLPARNPERDKRSGEWKLIRCRFIQWGGTYRAKAETILPDKLGMYE